MASASNHTPGQPPEIRDEAADTPLWVPAVGLALLVLGAIFLVSQAALTDEPPADTAETVEAAEEAPSDEEAAEPAAEAPAE